ncbi:MAG: transposase [Sedimentisphaerales bacterium]|nr:transposase [Sedimentisphaerales bacterium]
MKSVWPKSLPQKCQTHKMRNILGKLPRGVQGEMKRQIHRVFRAETYEQGLARGRKLVADYRDRYPNAMACLAKSLEECITCLKLPESHRRRGARRRPRVSRTASSNSWSVNGFWR